MRIEYVSLMAFALFAFISNMEEARASCSWTILTNGSVADANQVMNNLGCLAPTSSPVFSGSVGVGTESPTSVVEIAPSSGHAILTITRPSTSVDSGISFKTSGSSSDWTIMTDPALGSTGDLNFYSGTVGSSLLLQKSTGNLGLGTTSPSYRLHVNGSVAGTSAYNNLSDARMKKNVRPITRSLEILSHLNGVRFDWRTPRERSVGKNIIVPMGKPQVGFVAQDVMAVLPEAVSKSNDGIYSVAESKIVPVLVEAIKSQQGQIELLTSQVRSLNRRFVGLESNQTTKLSAR